MHPRCQSVDVQQQTKTEWWQNRSNDSVLSENVHVVTHARFSYSRNFKCHVFSFRQNSRCDARYASDPEKPVRTANFEFRCINSIRHYLSIEATQMLVLAFVMSRLDYCNSLLYGCPQYLINRLKKFKTNLLASSWRFLKLTILRHTDLRFVHLLANSAFLLTLVHCAFL